MICSNKLLLFWTATLFLLWVKCPSNSAIPAIPAIHVIPDAIPAILEVFWWKPFHILCNQKILANVLLKQYLHWQNSFCENACNCDSGFTCLARLGQHGTNMIVPTCVTLPKEYKESKDNIADAAIFTKWILCMQTNTIPTSQQVFTWKQCHILCNQNSLGSVLLKHWKSTLLWNAPNCGSGFMCLACLGQHGTNMIVPTCVTLPKEPKESKGNVAVAGIFTKRTLHLYC